MHISKDGVGSQHPLSASSSERTNHNDAPSTSYVSTLSNAFNISTPTSSNKPAHAYTAQSTPTRLADSVSTSGQATPVRFEAFSTPTRTGEPPRILTLSGHEAFQSPGTSVSPWSAVPLSGAEVLTENFARHSNTWHEGPADQMTGPVQDQEWFRSASSSNRTANMFETLSTPVQPLRVPRLTAANGTGRRALSIQPACPSNSQLTSTPPSTSATPSGSFRAYREQPTSKPRRPTYQTVPVSEAPRSHTTFNPSSNASLSPIQHSSTFPPAFPDGSFMSTIFQRHTRSLSIHLLPLNDLTVQAPSQVKSRLDLRPISEAHCSLPTSLHASQHGSRDQQSMVPAPPHQVASLEQVPIKPDFIAPGTKDHFTPVLAFHRRDTVYDQQVMHLGCDALLHLGPEQNSAGTHENAEPVSGNDGRLAGLGLDLNTSPSEPSEQIEVLEAAPGNSYISSMIVDEVGRWVLGSDGSQLTQSEYSCPSADGSRSRRARWLAQESSTASLGATTEGSFMSHSNASTWDSSFNDMPSPASGPPSTSDDSPFVTKPSLGPSNNLNLHPSIPANSIAGNPDSTVATPEVAMNDFDFVKSVSIEQMAEERWRTWPRNRDSVMLKDRSSTSALLSPIFQSSTSQVQAEDRTFLDSVSVSASSTRSRLMAEPYNKNMRSGRPSSSASTSSWSSIGNAAAVENQQSSGLTGPTRPRAYVAASTPRRSSATRTDSNGGLVSDSGQMSNGNLTGTSLALRQALGLSQGGHPATGSSSAMKVTRSNDALTSPGSSVPSAAKFRHSVVMQRAALSSDANIQKTQRAQSLLETTPHSESLRELRHAASKPRAKVAFNEVSVALDTLRMYLKQKEPTQSDRADVVAALPFPAESSEASSPGKPSRTLRRTKGVLPPRGAFLSVDEFGTLQTPAPSSDLPALHSPAASSAGHTRSQSLGGAFRSAKQASGSTTSRKEEKLAVVEDLRERVMELEAESERQKERHAAASMPPPSSRPAATPQRAQRTMTRREMQLEFLRKRASGC